MIGVTKVMVKGAGAGIRIGALLCYMRVRLVDVVTTSSRLQRVALSGDRGTEPHVWPTGIFRIDRVAGEKCGNKDRVYRMRTCTLRTTPGK